METLTQGPLIEQTMLTAGMDYYKMTMSQLEFEKHPDKEVTFTFHNRGEQRIADYVEASELQDRLDQIRENGWSEQELGYLAGLQNSQGERVFSEAFLDYLQSHELPAVRVRQDEEQDDLAIDAVGAWPLVTFWETVVMNEVSEMYFANYVRAHDLDINQLYAEGDRRLNEWTEYLRSDPGVSLVEFGTRRRFSLRWQKHVIERLQQERPDNLVGTSNIGLANTHGLKPVGTFAHELPMVYAGIADAEGGDIRASHHRMLRDWEAKYGPDLLVALSDTFTTDFFFEDFDKRQAEAWAGLRHDSGDPLEFTDKTIDFYNRRSVDAKVKSIMFSDALDVRKVAAIRKAVEGRIGNRYGVGTRLTNNLGLSALNVVMKATHVRLPNGREADTVKLSDSPGKHTGPEALVQRYGKAIFNSAQERSAS